MTADAAPRPRWRLDRWRWWLWRLAFAACLPAVGLLGFRLGRIHEAAGPATLPVLAAAPSYTMTNQLGQAVASARVVDRQGRIRKIYDDADSVGWPELLGTVRSLLPGTAAQPAGKLE